MITIPRYERKHPSTEGLSSDTGCPASVVLYFLASSFPPSQVNQDLELLASFENLEYKTVCFWKAESLFQLAHYLHSVTTLYDKA